LTDPDFPQGAPVRATPALGDLDGGGLDATVGSLGVRSLWSFHGDGSALTGHELFYWDDTIFSSAALHDVDGDGRPEAIVGGGSTSPSAPSTAPPSARPAAASTPSAAPTVVTFPGSRRPAAVAWCWAGSPPPTSTETAARTCSSRPARSSPCSAARAGRASTTW